MAGLFLDSICLYYLSEKLGIENGNQPQVAYRQTKLFKYTEWRFYLC